MLYFSIQNRVQGRTGKKLEQLEVVYQQWGSGIPKKHLIQLTLIILSCC